MYIKVDMLVFYTKIGKYKNSPCLEDFCPFLSKTVGLHLPQLFFASNILKSQFGSCAPQFLPFVAESTIPIVVIKGQIILGLTIIPTDGVQKPIPPALLLG